MEWASFDKKIVQFLQNISFHRNMLNFVLGCIQSFAVKTATMNTNIDKTPYNTKWDVSTGVPFKTLITQH